MVKKGHVPDTRMKRSFLSENRSDDNPLIRDH